MEDLALYALDALDSNERDSVEAHLEDCAECRDELVSMLETAALLALNVEPVEPPARLKMKVMGIPALVEAREKVDGSEENAANHGGETLPQDELKSRSGLKAMALVGMAGLAASFALGAALAPNLLEKPEDGGNLQASSAQPANLMDSLKAAPDSSTVTQKTEAGTVRVDYSRELNRAVFSAESMAYLTKDEVYQIWLKHSDGTLTPGGAFDGGDAMTLVEGSLDSVVAVALTKEPNGGKTVPTSEPLATIPL